MPIPIPWDLEAFVAGLAIDRSRPVELVEMNTTAPPWSLWVAGSTTDYIVVEQHTTPFHRTQLALRELGHLLLTPHLPDARGDPIPGRLELTAHPADQQALYDQFGHLLLERAEQQQELATATDPHRAAALRAAAVLEGRP